MTTIQRLDDFGRHHLWLVLVGVAVLALIATFALIEQTQSPLILYEGF